MTEIIIYWHKWKSVDWMIFLLFFKNYYLFFLFLPHAFWTHPNYFHHVFWIEDTVLIAFQYLLCILFHLNLVFSKGVCFGRHLDISLVEFQVPHPYGKMEITFWVKDLQSPEFHGFSVIKFCWWSQLLPRPFWFLTDLQNKPMDFHEAAKSCKLTC